MTQALSQPNDCNQCDENIVTRYPGPKGDTGSAGSDGANGVNAYTLSLAQFTVPAASATVTIDVASSVWMSPGQVVHIQNAGYYEVSSKPTSSSVTVENLDYSGNAAAGAVIPTSQIITPAGIKGNDGVAVGVTFNSISPTTTKGDLIFDNGANSPSASNVRLGIGADNTVLTADSTQATGSIWKVPKLTATGALDFASIASTASEDLTIALTGAAVGDPVTLGLPAAPTAGIVFQAFVSAADVVTVRATNITAAPVDPASASYTVRINKL